MLLEESTSYLPLVFSPLSVTASLASAVILFCKCVLESYCHAFKLNVLVGHAYVHFCGWDWRCKFSVLFPYDKVKSLLFFFMSVTVILYFVGLHQIRS